MANPDFDRRFAETGLKTTISDVVYDGGWDDLVADQPPKKDDFNSISYEQDTKLSFLNTLKNQLWTDTGAADAYVVDVAESIAFDLFDGFQVSFFAGAANTGASTINGAWTDGAKSIKDAEGLDPSAGAIDGRVFLSYSLSNDWFEIINFGGGGGPSLGTDSVIRTNAKNIAEDITFAGTENGMSAGPITIDTGFTVTVTSGSTWTVV